jgi:hypothetical protein
MVGTTKNNPALLVVPAGVVMLIFPEVTPTGAIAPSVVLFVTKKLVAATPLKLTAEALVKFLPVSVTSVPAAPFVGVKLVMEAGR